MVTDNEAIAGRIVAALEDAKAQDVLCIDVREHTSMTDYMVIASGTSDRHVRSVASNLVETMKREGLRPLGVEGENDGEWVLVDLQDALVHVMLPRVREFYNLEKLWDIPAPRVAEDSDS
ncbi:MAG: ribosome silencing factor [Pseudomonadota bacterium]